MAITEEGQKATLAPEGRAMATQRIWLSSGEDENRKDQ